VDTDFGGALSFRHSVIHHDRANNSGDPDDIVVELASFQKDSSTDSENATNKARLRNKIGTKTM